MSGIAVVRELMLASAELTSAVGDRVVADELPSGTLLPALAVEHISGTDRMVLAAGTIIRVTDLVQVTIHAADATDREAVARMVKRAGANKIGDFAGVTAVSVTTEGQGPDLTDDAGIKTRSQDFRVSFNEPA